MKRASKFLSTNEQERITHAVVEAESKTAAEILPVLASTSGRYDRAEDVAGIWLGIIAMGVTWVAMQPQGAETAQWGSTWARFELPLLVLAMIAGAMLGTLVATFSWTLRRLFTPKKHMTAEVEMRAGQVFYDRRVHHTQSAAGVLVYISLFERTAAVLADEAALKALGQDGIDTLRDNLINGIKAGDLATAVCDVIRDAGDRLAKDLPAEEGDRDELKNALVTIE